MPRTIETTVYQYDELSEDAQAKARDWYREVSSDDFSTFGTESVIDHAVEMGRLLGIEIDTHTVRLMGGGTRQEPTVYWQLYSQGSGASFSGRYEYHKGAVRAIKREVPTDTDLQEIATTLQAIQSRHFYRVSARMTHRGNSVHEHSVSIDVYVGDEDAPEATSEAITDALRNFMRWIHRNLEREHEYQNSDEVVVDNIRANEYEFDEDGGHA